MVPSTDSLRVASHVPPSAGAPARPRAIAPGRSSRTWWRDPFDSDDSLGIGESCLLTDPTGTGTFCARVDCPILVQASPRPDIRVAKFVVAEAPDSSHGRKPRLLLIIMNVPRKTVWAGVHSVGWDRSWARWKSRWRAMALLEGPAELSATHSGNGPAVHGTSIRSRGPRKLNMYSAFRDLLASLLPKFGRTKPPRCNPHNKSKETLNLETIVSRPQRLIPKINMQTPAMHVD